MKYLVNSREMRQYDENTTRHFHVPSMVLMERAATSFVEELIRSNIDLERILVICGNGNNGGDGLAIARQLRLLGYDTDIVLVGTREKASEQNAKQLEIIRAYEFETEDEIEPEKKYTAVIDAIFGVGLTRTIDGAIYQVIEQMNQLSAKKIAVDMPSGISADHGTVLGIAFRADITITFSFAKIGLLIWPGNEYAGKIIVKNIGIGKESWLGKKPVLAALDEEDLKAMLPERKSHSNKGSFGKLLLIAGNINMAGAACLAGRAAYAMGCGLVRIVSPEGNRQIIQSTLPEAILTTYTDQNDMTFLMEAVKWADSIVCGPGIGTGPVSAQLVRCVVQNAEVPVLMDADALNLISAEICVLQKQHADMIMTPHIGEMSRLTGQSISYIQSELLEVAEAFARQYNVVCVLKDERTVTSLPDGQKFLNLSGNDGMATAGSGDVLSGMIGSLLAQGMSPFDAAPLGVYLHGKAGDVMIKETGRYGLMASDLIEGVRRLDLMKHAE